MSHDPNDFFSGYKAFLDSLPKEGPPAAVRKLRRDANMSARDLSVALGCPVSEVVKMETGRASVAPFAVRLAHALGATVHEVMGGAVQGAPSP